VDLTATAQPPDTITHDRVASPAAVSVRIVIVNYRTPGLTLDCLDSLADEVKAVPGARVVVVEGGSGDDSADRLRAGLAERGYGDWVTLEARRDNAGFAGGNNAAIEPALAENDPPDFVWLLNPDTVVRPGALRSLLDFMQEHPEAGLAGSRLEDPDGSPQNSAFHFPSLASTLEGQLRFGPLSRRLAGRVGAIDAAEEAHRADWLAGASLLVRREVFDAVGPLDAGYFMYFEETDFCLAAHRAGFEAWYVPASRVVHLVGQASGVTAKHTEAQPVKRRPAYWFASRQRYFVKNHGKLYAALADGLWILGFAGWRTRVRLTRRIAHDPPHLLADFIRHSVFVKGFGNAGTAEARRTRSKANPLTPNR
jgi:GT2 family glycosyltransferase